MTENQTASISIQITSGVIADNVGIFLNLTFVNGTAKFPEDFATDYYFSGGLLLVFGAGYNYTFPIEIVDDFQFEENEIFYAHLSLYNFGFAFYSFTGFGYDNITISPSEAVFTIIDDDGGKYKN